MRLFLRQHKIVPFKYSPVAILMVHETKTNKTGDQKDDTVANIEAEHD